MVPRICWEASRGCGDPFSQYQHPHSFCLTEEWVPPANFCLPGQVAQSLSRLEAWDWDSEAESLHGSKLHPWNHRPRCADFHMPSLSISQLLETKYTHYNYFCTMTNLSSNLWTLIFYFKERNEAAFATELGRWVIGSVLVHPHWLCGLSWAWEHCNSRE